MNFRFGRSGTFAKTRDGIVSANKFTVIFLIFSCLFLSIIWVFFVSKIFSINNIQIEGLQDIDRGEVEHYVYEILDNSAWKPWDKRNYFFVNTEEIQDRLKEQMFLEQVAVDKSYPDILRLKIQERRRSVILASKNQLLLVDTNGLVTGEVQNELVDNAKNRLTGKMLSKIDQLPVIICDLQELTTNGYQVTDSEIVKRWLNAYKELIENDINFYYLKIDSPESNTIKVRLDKNYDLVLDISSLLAPQIETYNKFEITKPSNFSISDYVDVRVPGKLYIK